ncbi:unnamed protein product [Rotaria socialis]|uniref:RHS repeat-associated core domain-containing protein n=1 Tax=Rotaria socialis TaxID=392032 RepID=A0A820VBJ5_9BILA|nr:unnamed protein product [Rotaria socialis]CAF4497736.1 unnamed protein product [Rotaria socialis]
MTTISDRKLLTGASYSPVVQTATDYYAFGAPIAERTYNAGQYRYGFNGKEKLDELSGAGNRLDFGARVYDSRVGRFLSVDKMFNKAPDWTPYRFSADNPILYIDREGNFEIPIHKEITEKSAKLNKLTATQIKFLSKGAQNADYFGFAGDWHFDGRKNFSEIQAGWAKVNDRIKNRGNNYYGLGADLHNVQDFYSHSNYVELYSQFYKDQGGDMSKFTSNMVPLYEEGINNKQFKEKYLEPKLRTGDFDMLDNEKMPWTNDSKLGENTHDKMNKDSNESKHGKEKVAGTKMSFHDLAKGVASKATDKILSDRKQSGHGKN